jgi:RimJ/RimL family protein N-acetyltransferase
MKQKSWKAETDRLHLVAFDLEHLPFLDHLWTDPDVRRFLWDDKAISERQAADVVEAVYAARATFGVDMWVLVNKATAERVGFCGLRGFGDVGEVELLCALLPKWWGKGLGIEACRAVLRYGFDVLGLDHVFAGADPPNVRSLQLMTRLGMKFHSRRIINGLEAIYYAIPRPTKTRGGIRSKRRHRVGD